MKMKDNHTNNQLDIELRPYQKDIVKKILRSRRNKIIILPTGGGKTIIALSIIKKLTNKKFLILVNLKNLMISPWEKWSEKFGINLMCLDVQKIKNPEERLKTYKNSHIILTTIQLFRRDCKRNIVSPNDFDFIFIDEAGDTIINWHNGYRVNYFYDCLQNCKARVIGLMPPILPPRRLSSILKNLNADPITAPHEMIEPYENKITSLRFVIEDPFVKKICKMIDRNIKKYRDIVYQAFQKMGINITKNRIYLIKDEKLINQLQEKDRRVFYAMHKCKWFKRLILNGDKTKLKNHLLYKLPEGKIWIDSTNKKLEKTIEIVKRRMQKGKKCIILTPYIDVCHILRDKLLFNGIKVGTITGEIKDMNIRRSIFSEFENNGMNCLIFTDNIANKGVDIPEADCLIHYSLPWDIYTYGNRRGRVGRTKDGEEIFLTYKDTIEERKPRILLEKLRKIQERFKNLGE
jgi:ERCC4-related helicase